MSAKHRTAAERLLPMFPTLGITVLTDVLSQVDGNEEKAIDVLLSMSNVEPARKQPPPYTSPPSVIPKVVSSSVQVWSDSRTWPPVRQVLPQAYQQPSKNSFALVKLPTRLGMRPSMPRRFGVANCQRRLFALASKI